MLNGILNAFSSQLKGDVGVQARVDKHIGKDDFAKLLADTERKAISTNDMVMAKIEPGAAKQPSAVEDFLKYQNMSMAEKVRASYLSNKGLSEEDLAAMTPEERLKIEEQIKAEIKRKLDPAQA